MGFSSMNGRLRRIHIPPKYAQSREIIPEIERLKKTVSILPSTFPNGLITTFEMVENASGDDENDNNNSDSEDTRQFCSQFVRVEHRDSNIQVPSTIHRIKGTMITDHCWTIVKHVDDRFFLVLAVMSRLCERQQEVEESNLVVCTVYIYSRPIETPASDDDGKSSELKNYSIDCENEDDPNNPSMWTSSYKINLPYFATCMAMDDHILIIGSYSGAAIYEVTELLDHSRSNESTISRKQSKDEYDSSSTRGSRKNSNNNLHHHDDEENKKEKNVSTLRIMKPCIVQAISICYPYFCVASGDRIVVWKIADILHSMKNDNFKIKDEDGVVTNDGSSSKNHNSSVVVVASWHTKIDNGQSRITCIHMMQCYDTETYYLALSCWDGSAFIFCRRNHDKDDENEQCKKEDWINVCSKCSKLGSVDLEEEVGGGGEIGEGGQNQKTLWECPTSLDVDDVHPTFCTLFPIQLVSNETNIKSVHIGLAVSYPGKFSIQWYDISHNKRLYQDDKYPIHHDGAKQVNGLLDLTNCTSNQNRDIVWIDEFDNIHHGVIR